jgi:hypothetical protein
MHQPPQEEWSMGMRDGTCTQCGQASVYSKPWGILGGDLLDGKKAEHTDYLCVNCGAFEQYFTDPETLERIVRRAEQLGDWKRVGEAPPPLPPPSADR